MLRKELEKTYWLCIFGVNQHVSICGTTLGRMDIRVACASSGLLNICPASTFPLCQVLFTYSSCPRIKGQSAGNHRNPYILVLQCLVSCRFFLQLRQTLRPAPVSQIRSVDLGRRFCGPLRMDFTMKNEMCHGKMVI